MRNIIICTLYYFDVLFKKDRCLGHFAVMVNRTNPYNDLVRVRTVRNPGEAEWIKLTDLKKKVECKSENLV
jgi:hypothetical protein